MHSHPFVLWCVEGYKCLPSFEIFAIMVIIVEAAMHEKKLDEKERLEEILSFDMNGKKYRVYYTYFNEKLFFVARDGKIISNCVSYDPEAFINLLAKSPEKFPQEKIETVQKRIILQPLKTKGDSKKRGSAWKL